MRYLRFTFVLLAALVLCRAQPVGAQPVTPPVGTAALVCAFNTVIPAPTSGAFAYVQCDNTGKLITTSTGGGGTPGGSSGQVQFNSAGTFGGFTVSGDCTLVTSTGVITCTSLNGKVVSLSAALTTTGGATTLAFGAGANTYTFPNASDTVVTLAASQTLTNKSIDGSEINSGTVPLAQMPTVAGAPPYVTGKSMWFANPVWGGLTATSIAGVANSYYCAPVWLYQTVTLKALSIRIIATSAGNSSAALQGALYNDQITASGGGIGDHRPGTLIDFTADFPTGSAAAVSAALHNGTDTLSGPNIYWECVQKFDATATYEAFGTAQPNMIAALIGDNFLASLASANNFTGVSTTGTAYGGVNWPNFASSLAWTGGNATNMGPVMWHQVN